MHPEHSEHGLREYRRAKRRAEARAQRIHALSARADANRRAGVICWAATAAALVGIILCACAARGGEAGERSSRTLRVVATGYCPCSTCCGDSADGKTATGRDASTRGVAVDPGVIALGARLDIPGAGAWLKADDVGGAIKGNRIDVRFPSHSEASAWGRRSVVVRVWE